MRFDASDWLNPLLVKEVRQGLRTRVFHLTFHALLFGCVAISCVAYGLADGMHAIERDLGFPIFLAYFMCFALVGFLVLPMNAFRSFSSERDADTWPILQITGLAPRRILRGKLASALVQGALYASAIAPFLLFSYFLQGVSLAVILGMMAFGLAWQTLAAVMAVCCATFADSRIGKGLLAGALALGLFVATLWAFGLLTSLRAGFSTAFLSTRSIRALVGASSWLLVSGAVLLFEAAAARLSSGGRHDMAGTRLAALAHVAGGAAVWFVPRSDRAGAAVGALLYAALFLFVFGLFASSEAPRAARSDKSVEGRLPLLRPGGLAGYRFTVVLLALVWAGAILAATSADHVPRELETLVLKAPALTLVFLALPIVLGGTVLPGLFEAPARLRWATAAIAISSWFLGILGVPVLSSWFKFDSWHRGADESGMLLLVLAVVLGVAAERILAKRERETRAQVALESAA